MDKSRHSSVAFVDRIIEPKVAALELVVESDAWFWGLIKTPLRLDMHLTASAEGTAQQPTVSFGPGIGLRPDRETDSIIFTANGADVMRLRDGAAEFLVPIVSTTGQDLQLGAASGRINVGGNVLANVTDILGTDGETLLRPAGTPAPSLPGTIAEMTFRQSRSAPGVSVLYSISTSTERAIGITADIMLGNAAFAERSILRCVVRAPTTAAPEWTLSSVQRVGFMDQIQTTQPEEYLDIIVDDDNILIIGKTDEPTGLTWSGTVRVNRLFLS